MSLVVRVGRERLREVRERLLRARGLGELRPTNPYEVFRLQIGKEVIVGYQSGKIVATGESSGKALSRVLVELEPDGGEQTVVGSDEAGKGEWLGPMIVAAVGLTPQESKELRSLGVMDSKMLSLSKISELASVIREHSLSFRVVPVSPVRFNELMMDVKDEGKSLNDLLAWAHSVAVKHVLERALGLGRKVRIVIDEFDRIRTEERLRRVIDLGKFEVSQYPGAEEEVAVAAASILARDGRERWIDSESERFRQDLRKLTIQATLRHSDSFSLAKVAYLNLGRSEVEVMRSRFLQHMIMIEHSLRQLAKVWGLSLRSPLHDMVATINRRGILSDSAVNALMRLVEIRNRVANDQEVSWDELLSGTETAERISRELRRLAKSAEQGWRVEKRGARAAA